jgi:hypothetical protein
MPSEEQIDRAESVLRRLRDNGNRRPGDTLVDQDIDFQLRARATDVAAILLSREFILHG